MPIMIVCFLLSSKDFVGGLLGFSISTSTGLIIMLSLQSLMMGSGGVTYKQRPDLFLQQTRKMGVIKDMVDRPIAFY